MHLRNSLTNWLHQRFNIPYKLHAQAGGGHGKTVIFLHGIAASSESWNKLLPLLPAELRSINIDLLGFGKSPKPENSNYSLNEHVASIHRTIKSLKIQESYILVGHSLGSLLAAHYTKTYPDEVKQLYMVSPPIYVTGDEPTKIHIRLRMGAYARAYRYLRTHRRFTLSGAKHLKKILRNGAFAINEETWTSFERSLEQCIENQNVLEDLKQIKTPTKIFYGAQDPLIIPGNIQALSTLADINVVKVNAGHLVSLRYARRIARNLLAHA
jgi:pimeloyl-ACP methyl ester carboxylesterase